MVTLGHLLAACAVPVFGIASIAMPAGVGGGMLYVPLMILTGVASPRLAAVLASSTIVGAALAGNIFNITWQLRHPKNHLLDSQLAVAILSPALAGNLVGTILNQALPKAIILLLLLFIIGHSLVGACSRARRMWLQESQRSPPTPAPVELGNPEGRASADVEQASERTEPEVEPEEDAPYHQVSFFQDEDRQSNLTRRRGGSTSGSVPSVPSEPVEEAANTWGWAKFVGIWLCMILVIVLRGGGGESIVHIQSCSWAYWVMTAAGFFVLVTAGVVTRTPEVSTVLCVLVGAVSAVVGIGGAIVLNPMMVKRGVEVQTATATASLLVLAMSTSTTALFVLGGAMPPMPAAVLGAAAFLGSLCGKTVVGWLVSRTGRTSLIVILLAAFIGISGVAVLAEGVKETILEFEAGEDPFAGFKQPCAST